MTLKSLIFVLIILRHTYGLDIFKKGAYAYHFEAINQLVPDINATDNSQWSLQGVLVLQILDSNKILFQLKLTEGSYPSHPAVFSLFEPFGVAIKNGVIDQFFINASEPVWSSNIKRGISSLFQVRGDSKPGAFIEKESTIFGACKVEYYVVENGQNITDISKTYDMESCEFPSGIYNFKSNIPMNLCEPHYKANAMSSRIASYHIRNISNELRLESIDAQMRTNVHTSESFYPQFLHSRVLITLKEKRLLNESLPLIIDDEVESTLKFISPHKEATGGRSPQVNEQLVLKTCALLNDLAISLETNRPNFDEPFDEKASELLRLLSTMNLDALKRLYREIDLGTSYRQETSRNLFIEMIPRVGTKATCLLTRDLIIDKSVKSTTAVQMIITLPFHLLEPSLDLVKECELFLNLGPDRPDVRHAATLSYATLIYKAFTSGAMSNEMFEKYIKKYFDRFLHSFEYEEQLLYLEALRNLKLGNVVEYLEPIIKADYTQTTDIRFLAMQAAMGTAHLNPSKTFETYWPIFRSPKTPIQLRIASFILLIISNPTPGRILSLAKLIIEENDPQMINFYRTTVLSLAEVSHPCFRNLKRILSYMIRSLPPIPHRKYWSTGNYVFDYRDRKYHIGAMLQLMLIGGQNTDLPEILFLNFDTYALGRFTGQLGVYIKARGLTDAIIGRFKEFSSESLHTRQLLETLQKMKLPLVSDVPLHLEVIVRVEDKSILAFHLNQSTFHNLTQGDMINRLNSLLMSDTHLNFQSVLRPFLIQYSVPTLLGTHADILIESTIFGNVRGQTTQHFELDKINRNNHIDLRYSSYSVTKIRSYNPIEDVEYSTIREQGFLAFIPIINELTLNVPNKTFSFSFKRDAGTISGATLKSRTRNTPLTNYLHPHKFNEKKITSYVWPVNDLGVDLSLAMQQQYLEDNLIFMFNADVIGNARVLQKSPFSLVNQIVGKIGLLQLNSIQIGQNKHLTFLVQNFKNSFINGALKWNYNAMEEENTYSLECQINHRDNVIDLIPLHKWELLSKFSTFRNIKQKKLVLSISRKYPFGKKWKICTSTTVEPFVFLKRAFTVSSTIVFGNYTIASECPTDKSRIDLHISLGLPRQIEEDFNNLIVDDEHCPKNVVKFSPPPYHSRCPKENYQNFTTMGQLDIIMEFKNMSESFVDTAIRADHFLTAILPGRFEKLNLTESFRFSLRRNINDRMPDASLNGVQFTMPVSLEVDWKYEGFDQLEVGYGFSSMCSLIRTDLSSFHGSIMQIEEKMFESFYARDKVLLAADCTSRPTLAVFVKLSRLGIFDTVHIHIGGHEIMVKANYETKAEPYIEIQNERVFISPVGAYTYPPDEKSFVYSISINDEDILVIENELISATIQYDLSNILTINLPTMHKTKLCGVCSIRKL